MRAPNSLLSGRLRVPADDVKRALARVRSAVDHGWDQSPIEPNESVAAVFLWIPKNAGTTVARLLQAHGMRTHHAMHRVRYGFDQRGLVSFGHFDYFELVRRGFVSPSFDATAVKFAVVRNPFDRAVSLYAYLREGNRLSRRLDFRDFIRRLDRGFPDIGLYNSRGLSPCSPQTRWLPGADGDVDLIGRVEALPDFITRLGELLDLDLPAPDHENRSNREDGYREYYDRETRAAVTEIYRDDIERFGYEF